MFCRFIVGKNVGKERLSIGSKFQFYLKLNTPSRLLGQLWPKLTHSSGISPAFLFQVRLLHSHIRSFGRLGLISRNSRSQDNQLSCGSLIDMSTLQTLNFDNLVIGLLPLDQIEANYRRQVPGACFSLVEPAPVENPETVAYSVSAMDLLDLPEDEITKDDFPEYLSGNKLLPGSRPLAHCYCGHQFGYFSGQLGDGAAM